MISLLVVSFCIFLWMFLLGVWAGQTILLPQVTERESPSLAGYAVDLFKKVESGLPEQLGVRTSISAPEPMPAVGNEASFFVLQVASFREQSEAAKAVQDWQGRGYKAFFLPAAETDGTLCQVYIGKYENLTDANAAGEVLEAKENVRAYITLLPAAKIVVE